MSEAENSALLSSFVLATLKYLLTLWFHEWIDSGKRTEQALNHGSNIQYSFQG
jgi:hypothetical protein